MQQVGANCTEVNATLTQVQVGEEIHDGLPRTAQELLQARKKEEKEEDAE
jgi:hypothetical protein